MRAKNKKQKWPSFLGGQWSDLLQLTQLVIRLDGQSVTVANISLLRADVVYCLVELKQC